MARRNQQTDDDSAGNLPALSEVETRLLGDIRALIEQARRRAAQAVNAELTLLHWHIGNRILKDILGQERAEYGQRIVAAIAKELVREYGRGYARSNLFYMVQFAEAFAEKKIVQTLSGQLSWSHFVEILKLETPLQRQFYAEMCRVSGWSVRALRERIRSRLYERTAVSRQTEEQAQQMLEQLRADDQMTPELVIRDPYMLDFLGLKDTYSEKDLETAILRDMEAFLMELGTDFAFVARQKRMTIGGEDFYLDLLFYHRGLRRPVAVELKLVPFEPGFKGQMELYLRWLDKFERRKGEEAPIGLILCTGKNEQVVELMQLGQDDIHVAEYLTEHLPQFLLERRLQEAIRNAKERLALSD